MITKICDSCSRELPLTAFENRRKDCRQCRHVKRLRRQQRRQVLRFRRLVSWPAPRVS